MRVAILPDGEIKGTEDQVSEEEVNLGLTEKIVSVKVDTDGEIRPVCLEFLILNEQKLS